MMVIQMVKKHLLATWHFTRKSVTHLSEHILAILAVVAITIGVFLIPKAWLEALGAFGYLGVFGLMAIAAATIFLPTPAFLTIIPLTQVLDPFLLGLAAGLGSTIGEITGYLGGFGAGIVIESSPRYKRVRDWMRRYGGWVLFGFSLSPIFDIAGLVAGALRYPILKFFMFTAAGKILKYIVWAYLGGFILGIV